MPKYKFIDEGGKHIHTLGGEPLMGTSTILKEVYPPMLAWWAAELSAVECLEAGEHIPSIREEYLAAVAKSGPDKKAAIDALSKKYPVFKKARFAHYDKMKGEGKKGTEAHKEVENYIRRCLEENVGVPLPADGEVRQFAEWAQNDVSKFAFTEAHCYSEGLWVGGIIDFAYWDKELKFIVADRKTSKDIYPTHFYQTSGYGIQFKENGALTSEGEVILEPCKVDGYAIFQQKGENEAQVMYRDDVAFLEQIFRHTVDCYKDKKNIGFDIRNN